MLAIGARDPGALAAPEAAPVWNSQRRIVAAHTGGVLLGMRAGAALLWPADYGPRALGRAGR